MKKDKRITLMISGYYGFGNAGDEAILASIIQQIRGNFDNPRIIVLSQNPEDTIKEYNVESLRRDNLWVLFCKMREIDIFISGGGGLVQDSTGFATVIYYLSLVQMAKLLGKKVMMYAQGFGPINLNKSKMLARFIINQVDLISYRDEKSKYLSESIGIKKPPIYVTADPVFALEPPKDEVLEPFLKEEGIQDDSFNLGISVRPWESNVDYVGLISSLASSYIRENNANVFLFPFQENQDLEICKKVEESIEGPVRIIPRKYSIPVMFGFLGKMSFTIGMRLHSLIFSAIQGVPCIGVSYDPKVSVLMGIMGLPWVDVTQFSKRELFNEAAGVFLKRNIIKDKLLEKSQELRNKANENVILLQDLLK